MKYYHTSLISFQVRLNRIEAFCGPHQHLYTCSISRERKLPLCPMVRSAFLIDNVSTETLGDKEIQVPAFSQHVNPRRTPSHSRKVKIWSCLGRLISSDSSYQGCSSFLALEKQPRMSFYFISCTFKFVDTLSWLFPDGMEWWVKQIIYYFDAIYLSKGDPTQALKGHFPLRLL